MIVFNQASTIRQNRSHRSHSTFPADGNNESLALSSLGAGLPSHKPPKTRMPIAHFRLRWSRIVLVFRNTRICSNMHREHNGDAFGNVDVLSGAAVNTTATLTLTCSGGGGVGQTLCISIGVGSQGDATSRQLVGPSSNTLRYDLYSDSGRTQLWGSWETGYDTAGGERRAGGVGADQEERGLNAGVTHDASSSEVP